MYEIYRAARRPRRYYIFWRDMTLGGYRLLSVRWTMRNAEAFIQRDALQQYFVREGDWPKGKYSKGDIFNYINCFNKDGQRLRTNAPLRIQDLPSIMRRESYSEFGDWRDMH